MKFWILPFVFFFATLTAAFAQPANDNCLNAISLPLTAANATCSPATYTTVGATTQAADPVPVCWSSAPSHNVWFTFTPTTSAVSVSTNFTGAFTLVNTQVSVFSGSGCTGLTEIACSDDISTSNQLSQVTVTALTPGTPYYIMVDGGGVTTGTFGICVQSISPSNDNCANAIALTVGASTCNPATYSNIGATSQATDPSPSCWSAGNSNHGVWFTFQATSNQAFISTNFFGAAYSLTNTQLAVYSGTCGVLNQIACNSNISAGSLQSEVLATGLIVGNTYYIFVDGDGAQQGTFGICVQAVTLTNDNCANAISVPVTTGSCSSPVYTNSGATSVGDPAAPCWWPNSFTGSFPPTDPPSNSVWFSFVATTPNVQISTNFAGPAFTLNNTQIAVYSGTCGAFTIIGCEEDINFPSGQFLNQLQLNGLTVGNTYYIMVDGNENQVGTFGLCVQNVPAPPPLVSNQDCSSPAFVCSPGNVGGVTSIVVPNGYPWGLTGSVSGETGGCMPFTTTENSSFFYQFTADSTGTFCLEIIPNSPIDIDWAIFQTPVTSTGVTCPGTVVVCNYNPPPAGSNGNTGMAINDPGCVPLGDEFCPCITLTAGQTYTLLLDRWTSNTTSGFTINLATTGSVPQTFGPPPPNFTYTPSCTGNPTTFTNLVNVGTGSNATLSWNFGDGNTSFAPNPTHTYAAAGTYQVTLSMSVPSTDPAQPACVNSTTQTVIVSDPPQSNFTVETPVCVNEPSTIAYTGPALGNATYNWNLNGGTIVSGSGPSLEVIWTTPGTKNVSLQIFLGTCTTTVNTLLVEVLPLPVVTLTPPNPAICSGQSINLTADGAVSYSWSPASFLSSTSGNIVSASPPSPDTVTVVGTGANGCTNTATTPVGVDVFQLVFFETMGGTPVASPTIISAHENAANFDNDQLLMTGAVAGTNPAVGTQVRTTTPSTGYTGASGGNNVLLNFNSVAVPSYFFQIEDINTLGLTNLMLSFAVKKQSPASNGSQLVLEYSTDGANYTSLPWGPLPVGNGTQGPWYLIDSIQGLPATQNLRLRWRQTANNMSFQIDDITLRSPAPAPTVSPAGPVSSGNCLTLTASAANQYSWSGPGITPGTATSQLLQVCASGCYQVTVWDMNSCMKTSADVCVTITNTPTPPPVATNNSPVCLGAAVQLSAYGADPGTVYTWSGPGISGTQTGTTYNVTPAAAGTYVYTVTIAASPQPLSDTTVVVVNPPANAAFTYSSSAFCQTGSDPTPTTAAGVSGIFSSTPLGLVLDDSTGTIDVSASAVGSYTVTFTASGTCPSSSTQTVSIVTSPSACFSYAAQQYCQSATDPAPTACTNASFGVFSANPSGLSINPTTGIIDLSASLPGVYTIYNSIASSGGCAAALDSVEVEVLLSPAAPLATSNSPVCAGNTLQLSASGAYPAGTSFFWTGPGITAGTATQQHPAILAAQASASGTYSVVATLGSCSSPAASVAATVIAVPTPVITPAGPIAVCQGTPVVLTSSLASSGYAYQWQQGGTDIPGATTATYTVISSGSYTVRHTHVASNCSATSAPVTVTINPVPSAPLASNTGPVCAGGNLQLSASGTYPAGTTFLWSGPGITAATATQQHPLLTGVQASASGTYTVTATLGSCSSAPASTTATVNAVPATPLASSAPVCAGNTLTITVNNPLPGAVYSWITNTGAAYPATTSSLSIPGAQLSQTGTWTVYAASNGCTSPAGTVTVNVNNGPATPQLSNTGPVCAGESLQLSANGSSPTASYNWSLPNGSAYTGTGAGTSVITIPAATIAHNGTWTVVVSEAGCSAPAQTMSVTVTPVPSAPSLASNSPVCEGQSLNLTASSTAAGATYSWVYPDGSTSTAQNPVLSPATLSISGSYTVYAIVNGCVSPASTTPVVVLPSAVAPTIFTNSPVCEGEALQLSTVLVPGASYTWTTPGGNSLIGQVVTIPGALPTDSGTYTLNTPGSSGCGSAPGTVQVVVNALPDVPAVNSNSPVCFGSTITLSTAFVAGASYTWTAPDGQSYFGQSVSIPSATAADSGTYSVQVVTAASCASAVGTGTVVVVPAVSQGNVFSSSPVCQGDSLYLFASGSWPAGAVFSWTGPNYQTSLQNPVRANAQPSYSGSYTFSVSYNGCTSTPAVLQVVVHPSPSSPQASVNAPLCEGQDLLFTATAVGGGVYSWVNPQGQHFSSLQNPVITNATPAQSGVYTLYVTNGNNCTSVTPSYLTVIVKAMPQVNAVASTPLCEGQTLLLSTPLVQNAFYSWSGPAGFASTQHNPVRTNATLSMSGTYHVWVTREGCTAEDTVHVEVVPQPSAPVPFQPGDICEGTPLTLSAAGPALGHYVWTGPVSFTGQDTVILEAGLQHQGNYQVTVSVNGCTSPIGLLQNVVVLDAPNVNAFTLTASDTLICRGDVPVTLKATGAPIYSWSAPATGGLTGNPTLSQIQASPTATTTYTLVGSNTNGCRDTAYVTIRIAEPLVAEAGPDQSGLCGQDSVSLNAVAPVLGTGVWTIASGSGGVFSDNTSAQATFRGTAGQSYSLVWTVTSAVCGSDADTVQVSLQGNVAAPTATGYEACALAEDAPQPVSLAASGSAGVYEWYADSALTGSVLSYDSVYSVSLSQTSSYWVRSVENGCAGPAVEVRAVINPLPVVDAGVDVSIEQGQSTVLYASGAASYSWSPAMGLSAANVQSPVAAPIVSTTYTVSGTDAAGCTASDEVVVSLLPALAIPNGFTPNGDGSNDVWEISALTQGYPDCRVEIFNRWGGVVYASVGYFKPWDGKLEGKELPTATYYYMIYLKPGEAPIAGSVTIIR